MFLKEKQKKLFTKIYSYQLNLIVAWLLSKMVFCYATLLYKYQHKYNAYIKRFIKKDYKQNYCLL